MTFIVLVLVLAIVVALLTRRFRYLNKLKYIPGPKAYPLVGNAMDLVVPANRLVELFLTEYFSKYNQIFTLWMGPVPAVFVFQPQHMQVILGKGKHLDKPFIYMFPKKWVGTGLLTSTGNV
ncbi:Cytochrome P450 4C1 [Blattella germanica]|nr:Cytochrome P450 4C1 [Blattella germanica]